MIRQIQGDLVRAFEAGEVNAIAHQVNLMGVMGAGIARQISQAYPKVLAKYKDALHFGHLDLGDVLPVRVGPGRWVLNVAGQRSIGRGRQTDYEALDRAFSTLCAWASGRPIVLGMPFGFGCGLAGGDWPTVRHLIKTHLGALDVVVYKR